MKREEEKRGDDACGSSASDFEVPNLDFRKVEDHL
jgi:hypothetical protein